MTNSDSKEPHSTLISFLNTRIGGEDPRWRDQIRDGASAVTDLTGEEVTFSAGFNDLVVDIGTSHNNHDRWEYYGYLPDTTLPSIVAPSSSVAKDTENRALRKLYDAYNSAISSVESGQDFGEYHQSLKSFLAPADSLRKHVLSYFPAVMKRTKGKRGVPLHKALAETYLEWHFGWKPLAEDVADAYVGLQNRHNHYDVLPIEGSARGLYDGTTSNGGFSQAIGSIIPISKVKTVSSYFVRYKGAVSTGAQDGSFSARQVLQLDLPHFLPTAWDLIPYSFIADYFVNIGEIVRAYSLGLRGCRWLLRDQITEVVKTIQYDCTVNWPNNPHPEYHLYELVRSGSSDWVRRRQVLRNNWNPAATVPSLQFSLPTSPWPYLNLGALILADALPVTSILSKLW